MASFALIEAIFAPVMFVSWRHHVQLKVPYGYVRASHNREASLNTVPTL